MRFKKIPWFLPKFDFKEKKKINEVIDLNYLNEGQYVTKFERKIASLTTRKYCVCVTSGTAALTLAMMSFQFSRGDEIIIPNFTFIATANAVKLAGLTPVFVDINSDRFDICVREIEKKITKRTRAIIPVDVNGRGADYSKIINLQKKYGISIITDSSEGFGSVKEGKKIGSFGDISCFSFSAAKTISTGQGGAIVTNNKKIYNRLLELKDQGRRKRGTGGNDLHPVLGFNFKYTNLQAAVGLAQIEKLSSRLKKFKWRDELYRKFLSKNSSIIIPKTHEGEALQWFDILIPNKRKVLKYLKSKNIDVRPFWYPITDQKVYKSDEFFPVTADISMKGLWLPSYFDITKQDIERVSNEINKVL